MLGYWNLPDATAVALANGWLHTGDIMRMDDDGFLYFIDRSKDMIKPGGENVYSIEVESVLLRHADVVDCAVIGVLMQGEGGGQGDRRAGTRGGDHAEDLDAHRLASLAPYKRPRWYEITDAIPATRPSRS